MRLLGFAVLASTIALTAIGLSADTPDLDSHRFRAEDIEATERLQRLNNASFVAYVESSKLLHRLEEAAVLDVAYRHQQAVRAAQKRRAVRVPPNSRQTGSDARSVSSTAYCLTGTMANGQKVYRGAAAMNGVPLGSRWKVSGGPFSGAVFTVADRIGHSSGFDIAMPGDCAGARRYGRHSITVSRVG